MTDDVYVRHKHLLESLDLVWMDLAAFADAVHAKGASLKQCLGFIDGTACPISRPTLKSEDHV